MLVYTDQLNRQINLPSKPQRIISLVPSQTELLYDLGLRYEVVGITKFCIHPEEWFRSKTRVGGTKKFDFEKIKALQPDLIIGNKEENEQVQIEELMKLYPVWMSDIYNLKDATDMITRIGTIVGKQKESVELKLTIESAFSTLPTPDSRLLSPDSALPTPDSRLLSPGSALPTPDSRLSTAYFIWNDPYMVAGTSTFINEMLQVCGFKNVISKGRYPEVTATDIAEANPQLILLSSEPYPFKEKHIEAFRKICPDAKILIVDGEMFSWYGSRLLQAPGYFKQLIGEIAS